MNRKLFLIIDHGDEHDLKGVDVDKVGYLNFFKSNYGGAWDDEEIEVFIDNFSLFSITRAKIEACLKNCSLDFLMIVFCGHGGEIENGDLYYEFRPGYVKYLSDLRYVVGKTRCLFIADSCRGVEKLADGGRLRLFSTLDEQIVNADERKIFRNLYNSQIMSIPIGVFTAGFAASSGQYAEENRAGGLYSSSLLKVAESEINRLRIIRNRYPKFEIVSFEDIHSRATDRVCQLTGGNQIPDYLTPRGNFKYPFIVFPDDQRFLPDFQ